jgi:membrane protease YdiL (CAAX protease family)
MPSTDVASRPVRKTGFAVAMLGGCAITAAELSASAVGAIPGAIFDAALAAALTLLFVWRPNVSYARLLPVLALVALIRPVSLAAVVPSLGSLSWYALAGAPLLLGALLAARLVDDPGRELHLRVYRPQLDVAIEVAGVFLGVTGYFILRPAPLLANPTIAGYAAMVTILFVLGGVLEEIVFRGLVQNVATHTLGGPLRGVAFTAALNMALYWGSGSITYMLLMGAVGCVFGLAITRGASLWGVALGHGLMLVTMAMVAQWMVR